jgi:ribosomal-protein-serine acetyltransferase
MAQHRGIKIKNMTIRIDQHIKLELTAEKHALGLFRAVDGDRAHLSEFLPWVEDMQSVDDFKAYIQNCEAMYRQQMEVSFVIMLDKHLVGRIGLHYLNMGNRNAAIGYWLNKQAEGKGIMTRCCTALINYGFNELGLQRIEIKAATTNEKSQAIPRRLAFQQEGILRQAELVGGKFLDLVLFAMLKEEWLAATT